MLNTKQIYSSITYSNTIVFVSIVLFIFGLYSIFSNNKTHYMFTTREGFNVIQDIESIFSTTNCPNLLIQKGQKFFMYNTNKIEVPGVNPIQFSSLEEYTQFHSWLRNQGINCPILYVSQIYDSQGNLSYRILPDPIETNAGLPITKLYDAGHDKGSMPGFDPMNQYIGENTPLDEMFHKEERLTCSDNPMDDNWCGAEYSRAVVDSGAYTQDEVNMPI